MYVVNKNLEHNGKEYKKGSEIKKDDKGFELLKQAGHVEALLAVENEGSKQEEQSAESEKPARKSNR